MTDEMKEDLKAKGREDLVDVFEINDSGYAGVLPNGNIVSRLQHPEAIAVQKSSVLGIPAPKKIRDERTSDYVCVPCGKYFLTPEQLKEEGGVHTAHTDKCGVCGKEDMLLHIRIYNWLHHFKYKPNE